MGCGGFKKSPNYTLGPEGFTEDEYEDFDDVYVIYPDQRLPIDVDMMPFAYTISDDDDEDDDDEPFVQEAVYDDYSDLEPEDDDDPDYDPDLDYETEPEMDLDEVPLALLLLHAETTSHLAHLQSEMDASNDDSSASTPVSLSVDEDVGDDVDDDDDDVDEDM